MRRSEAGGAIVRRALRDARTRTVSFAYLFAAVGYANVVGYRSTYPTIKDRIPLARTFGGNDAVRLFYGKPHDLLSVGGYSAWRSGGMLAIFAAAFGLLAAVRALRAEEDAGRAELMLCGIVSRARFYLSCLGAIGLSIAALWLAGWLGFALAGLAVGESAYLALAIVAPAGVFAGVGAFASQLAPTRRMALQLSSGVLLVAFLLRVLADTAPALDWMRWLTPLGWAEELRPFTGAQPAVLITLVGSGALLLALAGRIAQHRDLGAGLLPSKDSAPPRMGLLGGPTAQALRGELDGLAVWLFGTGFFALIIGIISTSIASAGLPTNVQRELRKLGDISIVTPAGYIGLCFLFFVLIVSLFACAQVSAARGAEADQQLETLFAEPVSRSAWFAGRLLLAGGGAVAIALSAGALAWVGAAAQNAGVTLGEMLEAGANCLPTALLFLGLGALAFALLPRAGAGLAYGLVALTFVWQLFGGLLGAPHWLLDLSPFQHVGLVPAQSFKAGAAAVMLAIALASSVAAIWAFGRRDLTGD